MAQPPTSTRFRALQDKTFLLLLVLVTLAFGWVLWPFYGVLFWATVLAILFMPLYRRLTKRFNERHNLSAVATVLAIVVIVILPASVITGLLVQEGIGIYERIQSGELNFGRYFQQVFGALPPWATGLLERFGIASIADVQARLSAGLAKGIQFLAGQAMNVGQNAFEFVLNFFILLYLLFFFLRDGASLSQRMREALPLERDLQQNLAAKFANVIRATIKGNIVVAIVQGALGGIIFALLGIRAAVFWGVVMMFLSLLPAVGTALVWLPVAIYLLVAGSTWQGLVLIAYGVLVIGLVDNVLRPILIGKDTKLPDWIVLMSTLGGLVIFGFNGFVIGPVIAAMFIAVWDVVASSRNDSAHA